MIRFADWGMRRELAQIWQICFEEPKRPAGYFLNNYFRPENSLVYQIGGKTAAAVYLLPASVVSRHGTAQAHYIYAAATLPQYRSRGFMAALLAAAALVGAQRGDQYSVVLPATKELYPFYQKSEYQPFFQARMLTVPMEKLCTMAETGVIGKAALTVPLLNDLRREKLEHRVGSVLWSDEAFAFAVGMGGVYGDRLVTSLTGGRPAYALCRRLNEDTVAVLELMAEEATFPDLAANLIQQMPAAQYQFRLSTDSAFPAGESETVPFGMIKPIGGAALDAVTPETGAPYLGLSLD
ncbi:MAG: GNAT family N-acetyltransferase [Ruminococcaceae bacterium]|nr:GNAT family N-acetyltransferase [Oscillospiraceae bacterium]HHV32929.1 GNAT family N-acetyltransferase [Clostridiales bacterium]